MYSASKKSGRTAVHVAARHGESECLRILIEHGANVEAKDRDKATPLALAVWKGHCNTIHQLIDLGANTHSFNEILQKALKECEPKEVPVQHRRPNTSNVIRFCKIY